jgi:beta-phosphoglucomutase
MCVMPSKLSRDYKAVLFDFDGVLGKTLEDNYRAWKHALMQQGAPVTREEYCLLEGATPAQVAGHFLGGRGESPDLIRHVVEVKEAYYRQHHRFMFYEGALRLITDIRKSRIRIGLVSGAGRNRLMATCGSNFLEMFDIVVTADDFGRGKPAPDPYILAAKNLSLSPDECLVVENAPLGVRAAKAANMDCVAISSTLDKRHLRQADVVIENLGQLCQVAEVLRNICS